MDSTRNSLGFGVFSVGLDAMDKITVRVRVFQDCCENNSTICGYKVQSYKKSRSTVTETP